LLAGLLLAIAADPEVLSWREEREEREGREPRDPGA
jgi:hypothetical protein